VSVSQWLAYLERLAKERPWLLDQPIIVVYGTPLTLREVINYLRRGIWVSEIVRKLEQMLRPSSPEEEDVYILFERWLEDLYRKGIRFVIGCLGEVYTVEELLEMVRRRDPRVKEFVELFKKGLIEVLR